jgi:hypothetical protein
MGALTTSATRMTGGTTAVAPTSKTIRFSVLGTWVTGNSFTITIVNPISGLVVTIGNGTVTGLTPSFVFTYKQKMNVLAGTDWAFSAIDRPTVFNDLNASGRGLIELANYYAAPEDAKAIAPFQGKIVPFGANSSKVFDVAANPVDYNDLQTLDNSGTVAKLSVQAWGELELYFLDQTGIRSFRTRQNSLNAYLTDIGSPIDLAVQAKLAESTPAQIAAACGIVDPSSGRYWLYLKDTIYVLSNFPNNGIEAWATFDATYQSTDFVVRIAQDDIILSYGSIAYGMVNDVTKAVATIPIVGNGPYDLPPCEYIFLLNSEGTLVLTITVPGGVKFRGSIGAGLGTFDVFTSNQTAFVPQKFLTHKKQVLARSSDAMFAYGGTNGYQYDNVVGSLKIPWTEMGEDRTTDGINVSLAGAWYLYASTDYLTEEFTEVLAAQATATYDGGKIPFSSVGSRFAFQAVTNAASRAVLSALECKFN